MAASGKIPTDGGGRLEHSPFGGLTSNGLPMAPKGGATAAPVSKPAQRVSVPAASGNRGRVDIRRETGGRGGKTVTVASGFVGIGRPEKEQLAKKLRAACGCGGTVKDGQIEIQGDQRETVARILAEAGFRPVLAGG
jgi:translation initiation factor 1